MAAPVSKLTAWRRSPSTGTQGADSRSMMTARYIVALAVAAIIIGVASRIMGLPTRTLFIDESYTQMRAAGHTAQQMIQALYDGVQRSSAEIRSYAEVGATSTPQRLVQSYVVEDTQHPPFFYLLDYGVVRMFGNALPTWRVVSLLFGILVLPAAYLLAYELFGDKRSGVLAAAIFAVSPIERIYSDQAREYSLLTVLILMSTFFVLRATKSNAPGVWIAYAVLAVIGLYTTPIMAYTIAAQGAYVLALALMLKHPATLARFALAAGAAFVAYLPWVYEMFVHRTSMSDNMQWSSTRWPMQLLAVKWVFNLGSTFFDLEYINVRWIAVLAVVLAVGILTLARGFRAADPGARWLIATSIAVPLLLLIVPDIVLGQHRSSVARYDLPVIVMLAVWAAGGLLQRPLATTVLLGAGICAAFVGSQHPSWWDNDSDADDARIASIVNAEPRAQVLTTMVPSYFIVFAEKLKSDVRVSFSPQLEHAAFSARDPLFVLRPTFADLRSLEARTGRRFVAVPFARTLTAHDMGTAMSARSANSEPAELYRAAPVAMATR